MKAESSEVIITKEMEEEEKMAMEQGEKKEKELMDEVWRVVHSRARGCGHLHNVGCLPAHLSEQALPYHITFLSATGSLPVGAKGGRLGWIVLIRAF